MLYGILFGAMLVWQYGTRFFYFIARFPDVPVVLEPWLVSDLCYLWHFILAYGIEVSSLGQKQPMYKLTISVLHVHLPPHLT